MEKQKLCYGRLYYCPVAEEVKELDNSINVSKDALDRSLMEADATYDVFGKIIAVANGAAGVQSRIGKPLRYPKVISKR